MRGTVIEEIKAGGFKKQGLTKIVYCLFALSLGFFTLYTSCFGVIESWKHRMTYLVLILAIFLLREIAFDSNKLNVKRIVDWLLLIGLGLVAIYAFFNYNGIILRVGMPNIYDKIVGTLLLILVIIAGYRKVGWALTLLACLFIFYAFYGNIFPRIISHSGMSYGRFIDFIFIQTQGILGMPIKVASENIIMFMIFAAFIKNSGAGDFFINFCIEATKKMWGGPAKSAVLASGLMGTITGSAVSNVVATGVITIPLMKKAGYKPHFAAAVEAAASTGGMIMPPIMASAAFLVAIFTNTPFGQIMKHAIIPAVLYFLAILLMVHFEAKKTNLRPSTSTGNGPTSWEMLKKGWYFFAPIILLFILLSIGFSPMRSALFGIVLVILLSYVKKETRMGFWEILSSLEEGAKSAIVVSVTCAVAGIIVGVLTGTGLGIKFSSAILSVAGNNLLIVLILTMICALILGMGMTASAVYVIVAALLAPAIIKMGVMTIPAHFFVFYYGIACSLTPPVALASYGAAGVAEADPYKTSYIALRLAIVAFTIPYIFIYNPALLAIGSLSQVLLAFATAIIGVFSLSAGLSKWLIGELEQWQRIGLLIGGIGLITHIWWANIFGILFFLLTLFINITETKKKTKIISHA